MITVNGKNKSLQEALHLLVVCHLQFESSEIVEQQRLEYLVMTTSHTGGSSRDIYRGSINEIRYMRYLAQVLVSRLAPKPSYLDELTKEQLHRIFYLTKNSQERAKIALAIIGRSQLDDDVILKFSLSDLCTAYAFFAEAKRSEQMYVFDGALQMTDLIEA